MRALLRRMARPAVTAALLATTPAASAAGYYDLLPLAPDSANALVLIDVEGLRASKIAVKEDWASKEKEFDRGVIRFPDETRHALLASKIDVADDFHTVWDAVIAEVGYTVSVPSVARAEGGYTDTVEGFATAFLPRDAFVIGLKPQVMGAIFPANRQELGRWLRSIKAMKEPTVSPFLRKAVQAAHGTSQLVAALDTEYLLSPAQMRAKLAASEALKGKTVDRDALAEVLASLKGLTLAVEATEVLEGKLTAEFGAPTAPLSEVARGLILEVIDNQGLALDDLKDWRILVGGNTVTFQGRLSTEGMTTLVRLFATPPSSLPDAKEGTPQAAEPDAKAKATRAYFRKVTEALKEFRQKVKADPGPRARTWAEKYGYEIQRLPILGVDEAVVAYGAEVSEALVGMRNIAKNISLERNYRQATAAGNQGYYYGGYGYGYGGFYGATSLTLTSDVMQKQSVAMAQAAELQVWSVLEKKTADLRRAMTLKYNVEF